MINQHEHDILRINKTHMTPFKSIESRVHSHIHDPVNNRDDTDQNTIHSPDSEPIEMLTASNEKNWEKAKV